MDTLESYRQITLKILSEYAAIPYAYGEIKSEVVFDSTNNRYLLVNVGWDAIRFG
nr:element excision factor XisI family protein [Plectonema radiosum]